MQVNVGKGIELNVDLARLGVCPSDDDLSPVAKHVVYTGLRNILMDAHASATAKADPSGYVAKSRELVEKKLAGLYAGEIRKAVARGPADPLAAEIRKLAFGIVQRLRADELAKVAAKDRLAKMKELAEKHAAEHDAELRPIAERRVKELEALAGGTAAEAPKAKKTKRAA
jgi:hypothetical protein